MDNKLKKDKVDEDYLNIFLLIKNDKLNVDLKNDFDDSINEILGFERNN